MEINEGHDERVPGTLVPEGDQTYHRDNPAVSQNKTIRTTTDIEPQTNNTTRAFRSTETRYKLPANPSPKKY